MLKRSRTNSTNNKTDETALYSHFFKIGLTAPTALDQNTDDGEFAKNAPNPIITYYENQLILAEAQARLDTNEPVLAALNSVRAGLSGGYITGGYINGKTIAASGRKYDAYTLGDFGPTGLANPTKLGTIQTALLYEIIA